MFSILRNLTINELKKKLAQLLLGLIRMVPRRTYALSLFLYEAFLKKVLGLKSPFCTKLTFPEVTVIPLEIHRDDAVQMRSASQMLLSRLRHPPVRPVAGIILPVLQMQQLSLWK